MGSGHLHPLPSLGERVRPGTGCASLSWPGAGADPWRTVQVRCAGGSDAQPNQVAGVQCRPAGPRRAAGACSGGRLHHRRAAAQTSSPKAVDPTEPGCATRESAWLLPADCRPAPFGGACRTRGATPGHRRVHAPENAQSVPSCNTAISSSGAADWHHRQPLSPGRARQTVPQCVPLEAIPVTARRDALNTLAEGILCGCKPGPGIFSQVP